VAAFGLVAAPVLHAQVHAREAEDVEDLLARLAQRGADFDEVFARLWDLGHREQPAQHAHGPERAHGEGSLQHLALALHAPPAPPPLPAVAHAFAAPVLFTGAGIPALRYLTPDQSQGPPRS
jgi:hypothetical protein